MLYSFSLYPEKEQPSGTCNFSKIDDITLKLSMISDVNYENPILFKVYNLTYNTYINDAFVYLKEKILTYQCLNRLLTNNSTIVISSGRNGLNDQLINLLVNTKYITQIIYISCNINSMKRNMELLLKSKYKIKAIEVTDEFPNTIYTNIIISLVPNKNIVI